MNHMKVGCGNVDKPVNIWLKCLITEVHILYINLPLAFI